MSCELFSVEFLVDFSVQFLFGFFFVVVDCVWIVVDRVGEQGSVLILYEVINIVDVVSYLM